jgi:GTPase SAR1 family protein
MAFVNYATNNLAIKIVYYGPGLSGKTTNLRYIYLKLDPDSRGEFVCLETATDRTFFFDLLPIRAGMINDFQIHFQLLTVPGQVFYDASRKTVMRGADGIVFVADSQVALLDANIESFDGLRKNLLENDMDLNDLPLVFQYNKRDLPNLIQTLKEISRLTIPHVRKKIFEAKGEQEQKEEIDWHTIEGREGKREKKDDVEFVSSSSSISLRKIKITTKSDIEKEIDNLARQFTSKKS